MRVDLPYQFVDLVQEDHWIASSGMFQSLDDAAGHRGHICSSMSSDVALVPDSAEGDPLKPSAK